MDRDFLIELFAPFGAIDIRRMFGGMSLSADGVTFALVSRGAIYLKADGETIPRFEAEGCSPFQYEMQGKMKTMGSYWRMPERLYDDPDETTEWARVALSVARQSALKKLKPKKPRAASAASPKKRARSR